MNSKFFMKGLRALALMLAAFAMMAGPSFAAEYWLWAGATTKTMPPTTEFPTGEVITMWGFALDTTNSFTDGLNGTVEVPGPMLIVPPGETLTVHLYNDGLLEAVSIVIPGQIAALTPARNPDDRVRSFTTETQSGTEQVYDWTNMKTGTYLYQSGTHPAKQVQMGLYGAVKVGDYPGVDNEVLLLYSEIDPALHDPPATAKPLNYKPEYFLINGEPYPNAAPIIDHSVVTNENVLIRFLNAGLKTHVPTLLGGYMTVIAEDGNLYPYPKEQYSVSLPAGKTVDALWVPATDGTYPVYDARHYLTSAGAPEGGMLVKLEVGPDGNAPVAVDDNYTVAEDGTLTATVGGTPAGVLDNDTPGAGPGPLTAVLVDGPFAGTLTLNTDGSFTYEPDQDFFGTDGFTYKANDGTLDSNAANVTIMVNGTNDAPVANPDSYDAVEGETLTVAASGVLENDTDVDGNPLEAGINTDVTGGMLTLNPNGSFDYTPYAGTTGDSFTYFANDGTVNSSLAATVTITVVSAANQSPVAVDDSATTGKNAAVDINVIANDYDPDGFIFPGSVVIVSLPSNGTVVNNANGTVTYTPAKNYTGPDSFTYVVYDNEGVSSNEATVTVDVTNK